ncbi:MAG: hypothetical protein AB1646_25965 [Thermodesulfobacteriota bacterium]
MLSFDQSIAANLSMEADPDFLITINGQDVVPYCMEWEFVDDEEDMSEITIKLGNPDMKLSGKFKYDQDLEIRFGYAGQLSGKAYLPVAEVEEDYPTGAEPAITVKGRDESSKMAGGKDKGMKGEGDDSRGCHDALTDAGLTGDVQGSGTKHKKMPVANENPHERVCKYGQNLRTKGAGGSGGPSSPLDGKGNDKGHQFSSACRIPEGGEDRDTNRGENQEGKHGGEPITGTLELKGFPTLRAKKCVTMLGVGPEASGEYYVKKCAHKWGLGKGYKTTADLIRGGSGKGSAGSNPPTVMYADIWKKSSIYIGPRKMSGGSQATFEYGKGEHLVNFKYHCKPQQQRHGGEPKKSKGEGLDPRKRWDAYEEGTSKGSGS